VCRGPFTLHGDDCRETRRVYGTVPLDLDMAKEALTAFEATLAKEPRRLDAIIGAAKAAEQASDAAKARQILHGRRCPHRERRSGQTRNR